MTSTSEAESRQTSSKPVKINPETLKRTTIKIINDTYEGDEEATNIDEERKSPVTPKNLRITKTVTNELMSATTPAMEASTSTTKLTPKADLVEVKGVKRKMAITPTTTVAKLSTEKSSVKPVNHATTIMTKKTTANPVATAKGPHTLVADVAKRPVDVHSRLGNKVLKAEASSSE